MSHTLQINISFTETVMYPNGSASNTVAQVVNNAQTGFQVNVTMRRHPAFYLINTLIPIIVLSGVGQTAFALPEEVDGKVLVPLTVLLGFMFVQSIAAAEMPHSAYAPTIAIYITSCVILSGISCLTSALCMWIASFTHPLPAVMKFVWVDCVGFLVFPLRLFEYCGRVCCSHFHVPANPTVGKVENFTSEISTANHIIGQLGGCKRSSLTVSENDAVEKYHPWLPVAEVLNRIFGLAHIATIFALFFKLIFPLFI